MVCSQSRPLAAAIDGNFREAVTGEIDLEEDDPAIIGFMLEYLYKGDVSIDGTAGSSENPIDLESTSQNSTQPPTVQDTQTYLPSQAQGYVGNWSNNSAPTYVQNFQNPIVGYIPLPNYTAGANYSHSSSLIPYSSFPNSQTYPQSNFAGSYVAQNEPYVDPTPPPPPPVTPPVNSKNLVTLAAIYVVAEKYDVQPLKLLAQTKYEAILPAAWNTEHFIESLELIYDGIPEMSEPDSMRDLAIKTAAAHAKELMDRGEFMNLCKERGDFATDVFRASLHHSPTTPVAEAPSPGGSGIPRCRANSSHAVIGIYAPRTYGGPSMQRYKCSICNSFVDF